MQSQPKQQYLINICAVDEMENIPPSLIINWGATKIVPSSQWTMEKRRMKRVEIATIDDKETDNSHLRFHTFW